MSVPARRYLSTEEYLEIEREAEVRSEYLDGEMFAMAGGSPTHNQIVGNVIIAVGIRVRGRGCRVYPSDQRISTPATGLYTYPDTAVVCGPPEFRGPHGDTLLNPVLIFEVLSPSTEGYDRGVKFTHYQSLASLQEYVLIAQDRPSVGRFHRQEGGTAWVYEESSDLAGSLRLASLGCDLPLAEIYDQIDFPNTSPERRAP
jgi:Uma2 family endonuclease